MATKANLTVEFEFSRSTKGTHRFDEMVPAGKEAVVGALYVRKSALPTAPAKLSVTIKEA